MQKIFSQVFIFLTFSSLVLTAQDDFPATFGDYGFPEDGFLLAMHNQDAGRIYFESRASRYLNDNDSSNYIHCLVGLGFIERNSVNYIKAFDLMRESLLYISHTTDNNAVFKVYQQLGNLYGIYGQDSLAFLYFRKALEREKVINPIGTSRAYFGISNQYLRMKDYDKALNYLDSAYVVSRGKRLYYSDANYGYIYTLKGDYLKAEEYFEGVLPFFQNRQRGYLAMVYYFIGDLKYAIGEQDSAIYYYEQSLAAIKELHVHVEIKPDVLEKLSRLYFSHGKRSKAYKYMQSAKYMSDSLFNIQSEQSKSLFEIRNQFQEDLSEQKEIVASQSRLLELEHKAASRLKIIIGILLLVFIITLLSIRLRGRINKMMIEQAARREKNAAIIETKNKELTTSALQIIEKEHSVKEVLDVLKECDPDKYKQLNHKFNQSNKRLWDDFNLRFANVNNSFYENLTKLYPDLTSTDLKMCALIKLNFDSKEMAQILAISPHGVHTARSRVRKKFGLKREDSLSAFVASISN